MIFQGIGFITVLGRLYRFPHVGANLFAQREAHDFSQTGRINSTPRGHPLPSLHPSGDPTKDVQIPAAIGFAPVSEKATEESRFIRLRTCDHRLVADPGARGSIGYPRRLKAFRRLRVDRRSAMLAAYVHLVPRLSRRGCVPFLTRATAKSAYAAVQQAVLH